MSKNKLMIITTLMIVFVMLVSACQQATPEATTAPVEPTTPVEPTAVVEPTTEAPFTFGILMVGPYNDHGWSEAHYQAGLYVESKLPGSKMIYIDKVNNADRPGTTPAQLAEELVTQGAQLVPIHAEI